MLGTFVRRIVLVGAVLPGCADERRLDENAERSCRACPACAASMVCLEGASLVCADDPEPYSPIACARPDGTKHGQYKSFEFTEGRWIETDGWYVDGVPVGDWVSVDALGRVVRVVSHVDGQPVERPLIGSPMPP